jgi:hypothetical protein
VFFHGIGIYFMHGEGVAWLLTADHIGETKRFLCTLVAEPADD